MQSDFTARTFQKVAYCLIFDLSDSHAWSSEKHTLEKVTGFVFYDDCRVVVACCVVIMVYWVVLSVRGHALCFEV